jgi:hypothetical protein
MKLLSQRQSLITLALIALMAATRMHHFGSALHLPDASLSIFLLAGLLISSPLLFGALLLEATALDFFAITQMGIDNFCVTPAYWFLIPTYGALWFAGRHYASIHQNSLKSLGAFAGISMLALNVAFLISNGSFYLFSGRYPGMGVAEYSTQMAQIYIPYMTGGILYLACAAALYAVQATRVARIAE